MKWKPVHRFDHATTQDSGAGAIPQETILLQPNTRTVTHYFVIETPPSARWEVPVTKLDRSLAR